MGVSEGAAGTGNRHGRTPLSATQSSSASMKTVLETTGRQTGSMGKKKRELRTRLGILPECRADRGGAWLGGVTADGGARVPRRRGDSTTWLWLRG